MILSRLTAWLWFEIDICSHEYSTATLVMNTADYPLMMASVGIMENVVLVASEVVIFSVMAS